MTHELDIVPLIIIIYYFMKSQVSIFIKRSFGGCNIEFGGSGPGIEICSKILTMLLLRIVQTFIFFSLIFSFL